MKKINIHNRFSPLKEVLLGGVHFGALDNIKGREKEKVEFIFHDTVADLANIEQTFVDFGVEVHRPTTDLSYDVMIETPEWAWNGLKIPLSPRDIILTVGDTIIETSNVERNRLFERWAWHDVLLEYFDAGSKWISMPMPILSDKSYDLTDPDEYISPYEPLLDGANIIQYGYDIFIAQKITCNPRGIQWVKDFFGEEYRYHIVSDHIKGHLDTHFNILRPGLLISYWDKPNLPEFFADWDVITINPAFDANISKEQTLISDNFQDDDFDNTVVAVNVLPLDEHHIMTYDHMKDQKYFTDQLKKYGVEPVFVPFRHAHFFNQGIHCITVDMVRDGNLEDYTL